MTDAAVKPWEQDWTVQPAANQTSRPWEQDWSVDAGKPTIDMTTGSPNNVRLAVGSAPRPEDRLNTIRKFYPDAEVYDGDNFVYTHPETKKQMLHNPKGLDTGDVFGVTPEIGEVGGGIIGGVLAAPTAATSGPVGPAVGVGLGAAGGRETAIALARMFAGTEDDRSLLERGVDIATTTGMNAAGEGAGRVVAQGVSKAVGAAKKGVKNLLTTPGAPAAIDDFTKAGVQPTAGAVSGSRVVQGIEGALGDLPSTSSAMGQHISKTIDGIEAGVAKVADGYGNAHSATEAGRAMHAGGASFIEKFKKGAEKYYGELDKLIPPDQIVDLPNTNKVLLEMSEKYGNHADIRAVVEAPVIRKLSKAFSDPERSINYELLKNLRSDIGKKISRPGLLADENFAALQELYGALTDDMKAAATAAGPKAERMFEHANRYYRNGRRVIDETLTPVLKSSDFESAYSEAMKGSIHGASKLKRIKASMPREQWNDVVSFKVREMGLAKPGSQNAAGDVFSAAEFLTNYNKLEATARDTLFGGHGALRSGLDRLARITERMKDSSKMANPSGTAQRSMWLQVLGGGLMGSTLAGGASAMASGAASAVLLPTTVRRLITSPRFVHWLASTTSKELSENQAIKQITRLGAIAEVEPEIREEVLQYARAIEQKFK